MKSPFVAFAMILSISQAVSADDLLFRLSNTGVDGSCDLLPVGEVDPQWSSQWLSSTPNVKWATSPDSMWLTADGNGTGSVSHPEGVTIHELDFNVTGRVPSSVSIIGEWAVDDSGEMFLNGKTTGVVSSSSSHFSTFQLTSGFVCGRNTIRLELTNTAGGPTGNPSGFNVRFLSVSASLLGDINCDGHIDLLDVAPFVEILFNGTNQAKADMNCDGIVNLLDVQPFVALAASFGG